MTERSEIKMILHHIGIVVEALEKSIALYESMGYRCDRGAVYDAVQHIRIAFMKKEDGMPSVELIEPIDDRSSVHRTALGYHHMCYEWRDERAFEETFRSWKAGKIIAGPFSAPALDGRPVMFCCLANMTLVEFIL